MNSKINEKSLVEQIIDEWLSLLANQTDFGEKALQELKTLAYTNKLDVSDLNRLIQYKES